MVDIHTHILPFIDDGSDSFKDSIEMVLEEIENGVNHIFITPHGLRPDIDHYKIDELKDKFNEFKSSIEVKHDVKIYLGQEIYVGKNFINHLSKNEFVTMNNTNYILLELPYDYSSFSLPEILHACDVLNLKIIFAHIERYPYLSIKEIKDIANHGHLFQVNSSSLFSNTRAVRKKTRALFKNNLVSFVASDIHSFRSNTMKKAYDYVSRKYGKNTADDVFSNNAKKLLID